LSEPVHLVHAPERKTRCGVCPCRRWPAPRQGATPLARRTTARPRGGAGLCALNHRGGSAARPPGEVEAGSGRFTRVNLTESMAWTYRQAPVGGVEHVLYSHTCPHSTNHPWGGLGRGTRRTSNERRPF